VAEEQGCWKNQSGSRSKLIQDPPEERHFPNYRYNFKSYPLEAVVNRK